MPWLGSGVDGWYVVRLRSEAGGMIYNIGVPSPEEGNMYKG